MASKPDTQTCFYINKRLNLESWEFENKGGDLCLIKLVIHEERRGNNLRQNMDEKKKARSVWIHNIYNPSPTTYQSTDSPLTLSKICDIFQKPDEHILIRDFNLHHPQWNNPGQFTYHHAADELLAITQSKGLKLVLPKGKATWAARGLKSTIDLAFVTEKLSSSIVRCEVQKDLHHGSDHYPIATHLDLSSDLEPEMRRQAWKKCKPQSSIRSSKKAQF